MVGALTLYRTTIGRKIIMAVTGLIGIGFVLGHMYGNLKVFVGTEYFNEYAEGLRELGAPVFGHTHVLWLFRVVLLGAVVLHVWAAYTLYQDSQRARPTNYAQRNTLQATLASLYMRVGGTILFIFIILHLAQFTWGIPGLVPNFSQTDVYQNLINGFTSYGYIFSIFYLIVMVVLGFHLYHGAWSLFQTLGLNNQNYTKLIRGLALALAIIVAGGFALVPLSIMLGLVQ